MYLQSEFHIQWFDYGVQSQAVLVAPSCNNSQNQKAGGEKDSKVGASNTGVKKPPLASCEVQGTIQGALTDLQRTLQTCPTLHCRLAKATWTKNVIYVQRIKIYWKFQKVNRTAGYHAFSKSGLELWNELPQSLRSCASLGSFKEQLKIYLFHCAYETARVPAGI